MIQRALFGFQMDVGYDLSHGGLIGSCAEGSFCPYWAVIGLVVLGFGKRIPHIIVRLRFWFVSGNHCSVPSDLFSMRCRLGLWISWNSLRFLVVVLASFNTRMLVPV